MTTSLYTQIADVLSEKRRSLSEPLRLPIEEDLAGEHQVARDTVRRALKHLEEQGAVVRRRGQGTYLQPLRVPLTSLKNSSIGFVPPWWADSTSAWFTSTVFEGVSRWADSEGCHMAVLHADHEVKDFSQWMQRVSERKLSGLVWVHPQRWQMPLIESCAKHLPCVVLGRHYPDYPLHYVMPDYGQAARLIDDRLVSCGHEQYAMVVVDQLEAFSQNWMEAVQSAYQRRWRQFDTHNHFLDIKGYTRSRLPHLLLDMYRPDRPEIQAYLLPSSSLLRPLFGDDRCRQLIQTGEISIVTMDFGLYPIDAYWMGHVIDHVKCDWTHVGRRGVEILASLVAGHVIPPLLLERVDFVCGETVHPWKPLAQPITGQIGRGE